MTTKQFPINYTHMEMSVTDPLPEDALRLLPEDHHLRGRTAQVSGIDATVEVKVKDGTPLAANLDTVRVDCEAVDDPEDDRGSEELLCFIWKQLASGHALEIKVVWPPDSELRKRIEQQRRYRRWELESRLKRPDLLKKMKKRAKRKKK